MAGGSQSRGCSEPWVQAAVHEGGGGYCDETKHRKEMPRKEEMLAFVVRSPSLPPHSEAFHMRFGSPETEAHAPLRRSILVLVGVNQKQKGSI